MNKVALITGINGQDGSYLEKETTEKFQKGFLEFVVIIL